MMSDREDEFDSWLRDANAGITESVEQAMKSSRFETWLSDANAGIAESLEKVVGAEAALLRFKVRAASEAGAVAHVNRNDEAERAIRMVLAPEQEERRKAGPARFHKAADSSSGARLATATSTTRKRSLSTWSFAGEMFLLVCMNLATIMTFAVTGDGAYAAAVVSMITATTLMIGLRRRAAGSDQTGIRTDPFVRRRRDRASDASARAGSSR
jgi:hypothetical protein